MFELLSLSLAHKSEKVYSLRDFGMLDHDVRMYFTGPQALAKFFTLQAQAIAGFLSSGEVACYPEILGISYILYKITTFVLNNLRIEVSDKNRLAFSTFSVKILNCCRMQTLPSTEALQIIMALRESVVKEAADGFTRFLACFTQDLRLCGAECNVKAYVD